MILKLIEVKVSPEKGAEGSLDKGKKSDRCINS